MCWQLQGLPYHCQHAPVSTSDLTVRGELNHAMVLAMGLDCRLHLDGVLHDLAQD